MKRGTAIDRRTSLIVILISISAGLLWMLACAAPKFATLPASQDKYSFSGYKVPEMKPTGSVKLTIAVVNPEYVEKIGPHYSIFTKSFANALGASLDEIIVAKGMTVKGPYENLDVIPYPDKQATNLTLSPRVSITFPGRPAEVGEKNIIFVKVSGNNILSDIVQYNMNVEGWISLEMREPLSGEKMWIKKLDLEQFSVIYEVYYERSGGSRTNRIIYDGRQDAFADALSKMYPKILQKTWNYLNTEEMRIVNNKADEIRKLKRY